MDAGSIIGVAAAIAAAAVLVASAFTGRHRARRSTAEDEYRRQLGVRCTTAAANAASTAAITASTGPRTSKLTNPRTPAPAGQPSPDEPGQQRPDEPGQQEQQQADVGIRAIQSVLRQNQSDMADGRLSTLERVQKLMTSDAFTSYATFGRAGNDPECVAPIKDSKGPLPGG
ncbi:hypothetical protein IV500_15745 [Paeniglutamicibacter antarcticus]|uniref:Uncharacterized protein n=1 Tax=Arthrobacter terrae TaxID=2935737 RepID=A0A931CTU7_9MICC|nr:hypothetical protein [Arthrobacter terrae]MBG0740829.1 hypothetical protein [Arthrobacter terrae]